MYVYHADYIKYSYKNVNVLFLLEKIEILSCYDKDSKSCNRFNGMQDWNIHKQHNILAACETVSQFPEQISECGFSVIFLEFRHNSLKLSPNGSKY